MHQTDLYSPTDRNASTQVSPSVEKTMTGSEVNILRIKVTVVVLNISFHSLLSAFKKNTK